MRPRFDWVVPADPIDFVARVQEQLDAPDAAVLGAVRGEHIEVKIHPAQQHFWSPQLNLRLETHEDGTHIHGLYSPRADVWALFVAMYAVLGFGTFVALVFAASQWSLDQPPTGLWGLIPGVALSGAVYGASLFGQKLARSQMATLRAFFEEAISDQ